jgi:tetratricopeptide (TPR) repeat protein
MLTRLGIIYIGRKTWNDAKTVFLHILKESTYHSFAWRYLGLALTNLEEYSSAEEALNEAISLDIENPFAWAYLTIYCIKVERKEQGMACLNELIKMKFNHVETTSDIAMLFYKNNDYNIAANLYRRIMIIDKTYIDAQIKLAEIYYMKFEEPKKKEAIDILKNAIQFASDEKEKNGIIELIQMYENQMDYSKYSQYNNGGISNDTDNNIGKSGHMDLTLHSNVNGDDSEIKDNFK